jgi:hypothetical protein
LESPNFAKLLPVKVVEKSTVEEYLRYLSRSYRSGDDEDASLPPGTSANQRQILVVVEVYLQYAEGELYEILVLYRNRPHEDKRKTRPAKYEKSRCKLVQFLSQYHPHLDQDGSFWSIEKWWRRLKVAEPMVKLIAANLICKIRWVKHRK